MLQQARPVLADSALTEHISLLPGPTHHQSPQAGIHIYLSPPAVARGSCLHEACRLYYFILAWYGSSALFANKKQSKKAVTWIGDAVCSGVSLSCHLLPCSTNLKSFLIPFHFWIPKKQKENSRRDRERDAS